MSCAKRSCLSLNNLFRKDVEANRRDTDDKRWELGAEFTRLFCGRTNRGTSKGYGSATSKPKVSEEGLRMFSRIAMPPLYAQHITQSSRQPHFPNQNKHVTPLQSRLPQILIFIFPPTFIFPHISIFLFVLQTFALPTLLYELQRIRTRRTLSLAGTV